MAINVAMATVGTPATAQIAGSATISSDYLFRDTSIAQGHTAVQGTLSYDDPSGLYANVSAVGARIGGDPMLLNVEGNIGYVRRLGPVGAPVFDMGVVHAEYRFPSTNGKSRYDDAYIGLLTHGLSSRLYLSPDYFIPGAVTVYGEIETVIRPTHRLRLTFHVGLLEQVDGPRVVLNASTRYDVQIGVGRRFGPIDLGLALTTGGPDGEYYGGQSRKRNHAVLHAGLTF